MATKQYLVPTTADGNFAALVDGTTQTAATRADGWTVAKNASPLSAEFDVGTKQASGAFSSNSTTPKPGSFLTGSTANAFKTPVALAGVFDVGNWVFTFAVRATTASSQAGRIRMRIFKSVNADGSSATELTGATQVGTTSAALSTTADVTSVVTWAPGTTITLNNEFLFFVIAWEITTASGSNNGDVQIRTGQTTPAGSYLNTPNYTANTAVSGTDVNGTTTESTSLQTPTPISGTDVNAGISESVSAFKESDEDATGINEVEVTSQIGRVSDTDANGSTTESGTQTVGGTFFTVYEPDQIATYQDLQNDFATYQALQNAFPSYAALQIGQAPLPILTETASISQPTVGTDSGTASESASVVAQISDTDIGSGSEIISRKLAATDANATTTESAALSVYATDANSTTTEASAFTAQISGTDANGTVTEATSQRLLVTDSATGTDTGSAVQQITPVSSSDTNGTVTESTLLVITSSDVNAGISEITSLVLTISDTNATTEAATLKAVLSSTDANGTTTENGSTAQFFSVSSTDANGVVTESAAFNAAYVSTDAGVISEITSLAQGATDSNGTTTENALLLYLVTVTDSSGVVTETTLPLKISTPDTATGSDAVALTAQLAGTDANVTTESATPVAQVSSTDSNGVVTESGAITHIVIVATDFNSVTTEGIGSRTFGANDGNGVIFEDASLNTPIAAFDSGLGASESASASVFIPPVSDTGSGADSATQTVSVAPSDTILTAEVTSLVAKLSTTDQNVTTETAGIRYFITLSDSGTAFEFVLPLRISVTDTATGSDFGFIAFLPVADFNGETLEIADIHIVGSHPPGTVESITAVNGVDKTPITDINSPDRGILTAVSGIGGNGV